MKITYLHWETLLNQRLEQFKQQIRVASVGKDRIELSNGMILSGSSVSLFKKRIMNKKHDAWVSNIDNLISGNVTEKEIKSKLAASAGKISQIKHGERIRKNLNSGTPWNKGKTGIPGHVQTRETRSKISEKNSGSNNGMFGKRKSAEQKTHLSNLMKERILAGSFTPKSNNRNTHWESSCLGKYFRSSWEALYYFLHPTSVYEALRIEYIFNGKRHVYIVDFVDTDSKQVIEVKPAALCYGDKFIAKMTALNEWANTNGYDIIVADEEWLLKKIENVALDYTAFDEKTAKKIKDLCETNQKNRN